MSKMVFTRRFVTYLKGTFHIFHSRQLFFLCIRLREIDWLEFCTGTIVDSFATHVRLYRKAKESMRLEQSTDIRSCFFDLEAEYERGICRDDVCMDKDKEKGLCTSILSTLLKKYVLY